MIYIYNTHTHNCTNMFSISQNEFNSDHPFYYKVGSSGQLGMANSPPCDRPLDQHIHRTFPVLRLHWQTWDIGTCGKQQKKTMWGKMMASLEMDPRNQRVNSGRSFQQGFANALGQRS